MAEYAPEAILNIYETVHAAMPGVRNGGVIGDRRHGTGYHRSRNALRAAGKTGDYSIQTSLDKEGDGDAAAALDLTPSTQTDQHLITRRLLDACLKRDPRVAPLREFGGSLDSKKVTAYSPYRRRYVDFDSSHLWHVHLSIFRKYVNDEKALQGLAEVITGKPAEAPKPVKAWYHVDPKKVDTTLLGLASPGGKTKVERKPNFDIYVKESVSAAGRTWAVTNYGTYYAMEFLAKGKSGELQLPPLNAPTSDDTEPKALGWYHVDPKKVDTTLLGLNGPAGKKKTERKPYFDLYLEKSVSAKGRTWGVTNYGTYYAMEYLPKGKAPALNYVVDPAKVDSFLWGLDRPGGSKAVGKFKRKPGFKLTFVSIVKSSDGRQWGVTRYGTYYALAYLKKTS